MQLKKWAPVHCQRAEAESSIVNTTEFLGLWARRSEVVQKFNAGVGWTEEPVESAKRGTKIRYIHHIWYWMADWQSTAWLLWLDYHMMGRDIEMFRSWDESWAVSVSSTVGGWWMEICILKFQQHQSSGCKFEVCWRFLTAKSKSRLNCPLDVKNYWC